MTKSEIKEFIRKMEDEYDDIWTPEEVERTYGSYTLYDAIDDRVEELRSEGLSVSDAAAIWRSHGKDEDYMFGYTEEELENA